MKISHNGLIIIKKFEGCRLTAYKCAAGVWTIGYGHTTGVKPGQRITQAQADNYLVADVVRYEKNVNKHNSKYGWNQNEFDALVSFAFNIGSIDKLTANGTRQRAVIASKILLYDKAAGKTLAGLTARRQQEKELFCKPVGSNRPLPEPPKPDNCNHAQLNYMAGDIYTVQKTMKVRDKPSTAGRQIGSLTPGTRIKNLATTRVGAEIWMYFGLDSKGREQWVCADNGFEVYVD